uniref:Protein HAIKU1-like n=1 Tax=Cicer arietinum TaxID=3827 RepID=A0A1S2YTT1_CICAR|nr:protein HAIKU1-like [Cicer arietinum]
MSSGRQQYPPPKVYHIHKDDFKSVVQQLTGLDSDESNKIQIQNIKPPPPLANHVPSSAAPPQTTYNAPSFQYPLKPISGPPLMDMGWSNVPDSPISAFMKTFQESDHLIFDTSRGNQFQTQPQPQPPYSLQTHNVTQPQPQRYSYTLQKQTHTNSNSTIYTSLDAQSQTYRLQMQHIYPLYTQPPIIVQGQTLTQTQTQTQVRPNIVESSHPSSGVLCPTSMNATNSIATMNGSNQFVSGITSSYTNGPQSPTSQFPLPSLTSNMNMPSPQSPNFQFSPPSSPEYPFYPYLHPETLDSPQSPLSSGIFPFSSPNRFDQ